MVSYIYSTSKVTAKNILMKVSEAKGLFNNESIPSSLEGSLKNINDAPPMVKRLMDFKFVQNDSLEEPPQKILTENTESFEYSISEDTEKFNSNFLNNFNKEQLRYKGKNVLEDSDKKICYTVKREYLEIDSPRFTSLESSANDKISEIKTPEASPKQFEYPAKKMKFLFKLQEINFDSTNSKSYDSDRMYLKTMATDTPKMSEDKNNCNRCELCFIF